MVRAASAYRLPPIAAALLLPLCVIADGVLFWPAACLVAILAAAARHNPAMLIYYGLAVGFDRSAVLLAPFILIVVITARLRWHVIALAPGFALAMLVARGGAPLSVFAGLPPAVLGPTLGHGAASLWTIVALLPWVGALPLGGLALTTAIGAAASFVAWGADRPLPLVPMLDAALLCALGLPLLLPTSAPSAFLLAAGLALLLALRDSRAPRWRAASAIAFGIGLASWGEATLAPFGAVMLVSTAVLHARIVLSPAANDNPRIAAPRNIALRAQRAGAR